MAKARFIGERGNFPFSGYDSENGSIWQLSFWINVRVPPHKCSISSARTRERSLGALPITTGTVWNIHTTGTSEKSFFLAQIAPESGSNVWRPSGSARIRRERLSAPNIPAAMSSQERNTTSGASGEGEWVAEDWKRQQGGRERKK